MNRGNHKNKAANKRQSLNGPDISLQERTELTAYSRKNESDLLEAAMGRNAYFDLTGVGWKTSLRNYEHDMELDGVLPCK